MSYWTVACNPLRIRFSDIVFRSLAARIESIIVMKDFSTSGATVIAMKINQQLGSKRWCPLSNFNTHKTWWAQFRPMNGKSGIKLTRREESGERKTQSECWLQQWDANAATKESVHGTERWVGVDMYSFTRLHAASGGASGLTAPLAAALNL